MVILGSLKGALEEPAITKVCYYITLSFCLVYPIVRFKKSSPYIVPGICCHPGSRRFRTGSRDEQCTAIGAVVGFGD